MSIIDTVRGRSNAPKSLPAAELARKLAVAQAELDALNAQHGDAALDALSGEAGAESRLGELETKLADARRKVAALVAAHNTAQQREAAALASQRRSLAQAQYRAMKKHLDLRDAAAKALGEAIEVAAANYRALLDHSIKARAATPAGMTFPMGALCEDTEIKRLVENELYRLSAKHQRDPFKLPGALPPSASVEYNPEAIKRLAEAVREGSAFAATRLKVE